MPSVFYNQKEYQKFICKQHNLIFSVHNNKLPKVKHGAMQGVLLPDRQTLRGDSRYEDKH